MAGQQKDFKLPPTLEVIRGNIMKHGNPLALTRQEVAAWAKGLNLPASGEVLFFTGGEYQLVPFIDSLVQTMTRMDQGGRGFAAVMGVRNLFDRAGISAEKLYASIRARDKERYNAVSYKAAMVLQNLGLDFCYLGEQELYSGALLYEFGYLDDLRQHAAKVVGLIQKTGAKRVICLSPHSAEVFKLVYPSLVPGFSIEVKSFIEAVWELIKDTPGKLKPSFDGAVTIHDSCRLARELGVTEEIRQALAENLGVKIIEAEKNRRWTSCCGGPSKVLFPEVSAMISSRRVAELAATGADVALTFCPYCLAALDTAAKDGDQGMLVEDVIEFLYRGVAK